MDSQFNTLIRSYHDNYLQYKLTGTDSYKNAYSSAQQGIETILSTLQDSVESQKATISNFYKEDVEGKLKSLQSESKSLQHGLIEQKDQLTAAEIRQSQSTSTPLPSLTSRYIAIGSLVAVISLLALM
jgi:hypothetical protein